jgi:hypothetical protein
MYYTDGPPEDDDRVQELPDGFERLGREDTPFTLRGGEKKRTKAEYIHQQRDSGEKRRDEQRHQPVTRDINEWKADLSSYDFPFVDTISFRVQLKRAEGALNIARDEGIVQDVSRDIDFDRNKVRGRFWPGTKEIELGTSKDDFPGYREAVVLAHEIGHAFAADMVQSAGYEEGETLFSTQQQRKEAKAISERLHGPIQESDEHGFKNYRLGSNELFAQVFASLVIEALATFRIAPEAATRVESLLREKYGPRSDMIIDL